jgi:hypothetical protein
MLAQAELPIQLPYTHSLIAQTSLEPSVFPSLASNSFFFFFLPVLDFELRAYTLSHCTSPSYLFLSVGVIHVFCVF